MKSLKKIIMSPAFAGGLGILNILLANGNIWMHLTGALLILVAITDFLDN